MSLDEAALALADAVKEEMLMPFSFWEIDGMFIAVYQDEAAASFREHCATASVRKFHHQEASDGGSTN